MRKSDFCRSEQRDQREREIATQPRPLKDAESERRIGIALEALDSDARRGLLVGSKVGDECPPYSDNGGFSAFSYDGVKSSIEHSLKQLRVLDRLDTVLVHDPTMAELEEFLAPGSGGMAALVALKEEGAVGHIGIGCVEHEQHRAFLSSPDFQEHAEIVLSVNDFNLVRRYGPEGSWLDAEKGGAGILNAGTFYMGLLADPEASWSQGFKSQLDQPGSFCCSALLRSALLCSVLLSSALLCSALLHPDLP